MALSDFTQDHVKKKKNRNVVVCIYPEQGDVANKSHLNRSLEKLQKKLWEEKKDHEELYIAFTYGDSVCNARDFEKMEEEKICYLERCEESPKLRHVWFLGMVLLEKKICEDRKRGISSKNEFYLLTDKAFRKVEERQIVETSRFKELDVIFKLVKSENAGGTTLEKYISEYGEIYIDTEFC